MEKKVAHIYELTVKPCDQYPSDLIKNVIGIMSDMIIYDNDQEEYIKDKMQLIKDLARPIIEAIKKNEEDYKTLLKEVQK